MLLFCIIIYFRFENTVVAQFHGHTHNDHYLLYFDESDSERATSVAFIGGSGTAFSDVNPNYRIYIVDGEYDGTSYVSIFLQI
jgi:sphingomyelin phosphodiesterase